MPKRVHHVHHVLAVVVGATVAATIALGARLARAETKLVVDRTEKWTADDEQKCLAENDDRTPAIVAEREERVPSAPTVHIDGALEFIGGSGTPGGVGGYLGAINKKTPVGLGYGAYVGADVMSLRPVWLSVQAHLLSSPNLASATLMADVLVGYDLFSKYGNTFSKRWSRSRYPPYERHTVYGCGLGRADFAVVGGVKRVYVLDDPRLSGFTAISGGAQFRALSHILGGSIGIDFDLLALYDPILRTGGAQVHDVLHVGRSFVFTQTAGGLWGRGIWVMMGIGGSFVL